MKINGQLTDAKHFAFDGCHKIYLIESEPDAAEARHSGYDIRPIEELESAYESSCGLRFISNWQLDKSFVGQFQGVVTFE